MQYRNSQDCEVRSGSATEVVVKRGYMHCILRTLPHFIQEIPTLRLKLGRYSPDTTNLL